MAVGWERMVMLLTLLWVPFTACSGDDDGPSGEPSGDEETDEPSGPRATAAPVVEPLRHGSFDALIPRPTQVAPADGELPLVASTVAVVDEGAEAQGATAAVELLRGYLGRATGLELPVVSSAEVEDEEQAGPTITFTTSDDEGLGAEGYELSIQPDRLDVRAAGAAGFGWAVQTIRQLLPPEVEGSAVQPGTWTLPVGTVRDVPRFGWRGAMLDVARHFFPPEDVERVIDLLAMYKLNRLHLHLTDDQGWRLEIAGYPELTAIGAATEVGGGPGGFYTQEQYRGLVAYAAARGIVVVPEIDMPGHTAAALASLPYLTCAGTPPPSIPTGFSSGSTSLCTDQEQTYQFVGDVINEVASLTPGPYIHFGADEAGATEADDYRRFVGQVGEIVRAAGKQPMGWDEIATTELGPGSVVQVWSSVDNAAAAASQGAGLVMSPASRAYLDMKYDSSTPIGLTWAGTINSQRAYEWDPATFDPRLPVDQVLGLEAPLWTETVTTRAEIEQMMLPRLPGYAELGWSSPDGRTWDEYRVRLASHGARWTASGRAFTRDPVVPWPA